MFRSHNHPSETALRGRNRLSEIFALVSVLVLLVLSGAASYKKFSDLTQNRDLVRHTNEVRFLLETTEALVKEAQTDQRGYLLTGDEAFLTPFRKECQQLAQSVEEVGKLTVNNSVQQERIPQLQQLIAQHIREMNNTIDVRRQEGLQAATQAVNSGVTRRTKDAIGNHVDLMRQTEELLLIERQKAAADSYRMGKTTTIISTLMGLTLVAGMIILLQRNRRRAELNAAVSYAQSERLRVTLASIGEGVISTDHAGRVTYINDVAQWLTGWTDTDAKNQPLEKVFSLVNENDRDTIDNLATRVLRGGAIDGDGKHSLLVSKSGRETPVDENAAPIRDAQGRTVGVILVFRDVSQQRKEERQLVESAAFTHSIIASLSQIVIVLDGQDHILSINNVGTELFGMTEEELLHQSIVQLTNQKLENAAMQTLLDNVRAGHTDLQELETACYSATLGDRILRFEAKRFDRILKDKGSILLVISDLTDERNLEAKHRHLDLHMRWFLEQIQDYAIFTMDADCRSTSWNQGVQKVLGFSEAEFVGQDMRYLIFTPEAVADGSAHSEFVTAAEKGRANDDRWMMRKGNEQFWASGVTNSIVDENGMLVGFSKLMRDQTQRKMTQDQLADLASMLSESNRRKNEFLATLAHELRNPLAPIKNAVQLMGMTQLDQETEDLRQTMARQVEQLVRLIDDLLDVSRISRGKISLRKQIVDLRSIIDAAVEASGSFILEAGQTLSVKCTNDEIYLDADASRMTQVISNLLNNACKYSHPGCKIDLLVDERDGKAIISVTDNGIGIAEDRLNDIFQMFNQVNDSLERGSAGLGIGLTLVRTLVELHDGTVSASSDGIGHGSTFVVEMPLVKKPAVMEIKPDAIEQKFIRSFRVLVVEDQQALRVVMSRLLQRMGHEVETAEHGAEALDLLSRYSPEVVFSDISMPGMTGYELVRRMRLRDDASSMYYVAMTGYGQSSDRDKALEAGFDEHLVKPVDMTRLRDLFGMLTAAHT